MAIVIKGKTLDSTWIKKHEGLPKEAIDFAEALGEELVDKKPDGKIGFNQMTTSQVRNFFGEIRRIQMKGYDNNKGAFQMLKPKLAYAVARSKGQNKIRDFQRVVNELIVQVATENDYNNFVNFMEAIVAYHKANGGKD